MRFDCYILALFENLFKWPSQVDDWFNQGSLDPHFLMNVFQFFLHIVVNICLVAFVRKMNLDYYFYYNLLIDHYFWTRFCRTEKRPIIMCVYILDLMCLWCWKHRPTSSSIQLKTILFTCIQVSWWQIINCDFDNDFTAHIKYD